MKQFNYKNAFLFVFILATFNVFAQKQLNPLQDLRSPIKPKKSNTETIPQTNKSSEQTGLKIETIKGSFGISIAKYNLTKEQIEANFKSYFSLNANHSFKQIKQSEDELGFTHINYQQLYNNIPVDGAMIMLHLKNGKPNSLNGQIAAIQNLNTTATINADKALQIAKQYTKVTDLIQVYPVYLLIAQIPTENGFKQRLAFKVRIDANKPFTMCNVFVDAINGQVVNKISLITDADATATANTLYSGAQTIKTDSYNGGYRLRDSARKIETYDATNATGSPNYTGYSDYLNVGPTWLGVPKLSSFTISSIAQSWWYTSIVDVLPDLYIKIIDGSNNVVYNGVNNYISNTNPPVTFSTPLYLNNPPYKVEIWDYDAVGGDDFGGSYVISTTAGSHTWSGNGNNGQYIVSPTSNNPALDVHWGMEKTYDFYKNVFGRNSYDGLGSIIKNFVNPPDLQPNSQNGVNNAFANGNNVMCYGLGDGSFMKPVVALDVAGHEFTHMVVDKNGNGGLNYQGESGALNESFADIFGTCIEFYSRPASANWLIGEDVMVSAPNLRSLSNPNQGYYAQPDTYNGTYWQNPNCGTPDPYTNDNCGVHGNSGVQNYWFYLLCQGGSGTNDIGNTFNVTGIGITQARQIVYKNLTTYLGGSNATYQDAYNGSLLAAEALYGNPSTQYTAVRAAWYAVGIGNNPISYCSGTTYLSDAIGTITDGSGSANYNNNSNCKWVITPPGADSIKITFTSLKTELNYDTVFIYDGPNDVNPIWWTGNWTIPPKFTSTVGEVIIRFSSDNSNTAAGWSLNYTTYGKTPSCDGGNLLTMPTGSFTDGSGTSNYGNNQYCYWRIAPPCATSVTLNFTQFNTESGYDFVRVYDGSTFNLLGTYTGSTLPSAVTSTSGDMLVVFESDYSLNYQGFTANYTSTGSSYCSGTTVLNTLDYGSISDGSGANNYCNNSNCSWLIQPPQATSVTLNFSAFDLESASSDGQSIYDAVEVYNGTSTSAPLLGRFSGNNIPPSLTASSGSMFIHFFSDISINKTGWSAYYTSTSPSYCNAATALTSPTGTITDGSGSEKYANNSNCSWLIQPTGAKNITLMFTAFNTELNYDGVIVYDGKNDSATVLGQYTGSTIPSAITSTGGSMFIKFLSDESSRLDGFSANYTSNLYPSIVGNVITPIKKAINKTKIKLTGFNTDSINTGTSGIYNFNYVKGTNYTLRPTKNNDLTKANGINTTDVLLVQRHILNTTKITNPYKLIAADVTGDKVINTTDVLRIKRLILGTDTTFTKTVGTVKTDRLWEFVDSAYVFPDTTNPFPFKDSISFTNLTSNKINQTFIGVKLGDVNYTWDSSKARGVTTKPVELVVSGELLVINGEIHIPIKVNNFKELVAMQYTLHFNNNDYEFVGIENNKLGIDFNDKQANKNGNISFLWTDKTATEKTLDDGSELFVLVLRSTVDSRQSTDLELTITNDITDIAAWDKDFNQHHIILTQQQKLQTPNTEQWVVSPNPTNGDIKVNMLCKTNKTIHFELSDAQGRSLLQQSFEAVKGNNTFNMNLKKNTHLPNGIYFLKAIGLEGEDVKKLIVE